MAYFLEISRPRTQSAHASTTHNKMHLEQTVFAPKQISLKQVTLLLNLVYRNKWSCTNHPHRNLPRHSSVSCSRPIQLWSSNVYSRYHNSSLLIHKVDVGLNNLIQVNELCHGDDAIKAYNGFTVRFDTRTCGSNVIKVNKLKTIEKLIFLHHR